MATRTTPALITFFAFFLITFAHLQDMATSTVVCDMEAKPSRTWQGQCFRESSCDRKCQHWENADHGTCHGSNIISKKCFCYYKSESCDSEFSTVGSSNNVGAASSTFRIPTQRGFSTVGGYNKAMAMSMANVGN